LVRLAAERDLDGLLSERAGLDEALLALLPNPVCGCEIAATVVTSAVLPPELRRLFSEVERARSEAKRRWSAPAGRQRRSAPSPTRRGCSRETRS
jgi:hypothetical protein